MRKYPNRHHADPVSNAVRRWRGVERDHYLRRFLRALIVLGLFIAGVLYVANHNLMPKFEHAIQTNLRFTPPSATTIPAPAPIAATTPKLNIIPISTVYHIAGSVKKGGALFYMITSSENTNFSLLPSKSCFMRNNIPYCLYHERLVTKP